MKMLCTRRIQFCAGHRLLGHQGKCRHLHGHNYVVLFTAWLDDEVGVDDIGRVVDFAVLKERLGGWIEEWWDHGFIINEHDPAARGAMSKFRALVDKMEGGRGVVQKLYMMTSNPTAENMAAHLLRDVCPRLMEGTGVTVTEVTLWETENCYATVKL